ncbi:phage major tail tube protein, partial [Salmonella enterica]|nr:phage major tail tube protein [Salmonella enterica]
MLPRVLKNFNVFVEGIGYAGRAKECEPPEVEVSTDDYRA